MPLLDSIPVAEDEKKQSLFDAPLQSELEIDRAKTNLDLAQDINPDDEAKVLDISRRTGHSPNIVREDTEGTLAKQLEAQKGKELATQHKGLGKFLTDFDNATLARDDVENLAEVEKAIGSAPDPMDPFVERPDSAIADGFQGFGKSMLKQVARTFPSWAKTGLDSAAWLYGTLDSAALGIEQVTGFERGGLFGALEKDALAGSKLVEDFWLKNPTLNLPKEKQERLWDNPQYLLDPEWMAFNVGEVAQSFVPVIGATLVGGPVAGAAVGADMEGSNLYADLRSQGVSAEKASTASLAFGVVVGYLNKIGLDRILKKVPAGSAIGKMMHRVTTGGVEAGTEWAEEPFQAAFESLAKGEDIPATLANITDSLKNVEVIPGSFFMGAGLNSSISQAAQGTQQSKQFADQQAAINEAVNNTLIKERSPEKVKEFLETAGIGEEVFLSPDGVKTLFQSDPDLAEDILKRMGVSPSEAFVAAQSGQAIRVQTSNVHAFLTPEEFNTIFEDLKPAPGAYTTREINNRDAIDEITRLTDLYAEMAKDDVGFQQELTRIRGEVVEAISGLEQFQNTNVEEYAATIVQKYEAVANRLALEGRDRIKFLKSIDIAHRELPGDFQQPISRDDRFDSLANAQRGRPERAMLRVQREMSGGVLSPVVEHAGDLTHRMAQTPSFFKGGLEWVKPKVDLIYSYLYREYGFEKEYRENVKNNAAYKEKDVDQYQKDLDALLLQYADEHAQLKTYNEVQTLARDLAVAIGRQEWGEARRLVSKLKEHTDQGEEHWRQVALKDNMGVTADTTPEQAAEILDIEYKGGAEQGVFMFQDNTTGSITVEKITDLPAALKAQREKFGRKYYQDDEGNVVPFVTRPERDFRKKILSDVDNRVEEILNKVDEYEDWKFDVGDRVVGSVKGKAYRILGGTWNKRSGYGYLYETLDGKERGVFQINRGAHETLKLMEGPKSLYQEDQGELGGYAVYDENDKLVMSTSVHGKENAEAKAAEIGGVVVPFFKPPIATGGVGAIKSNKTLKMFNDPMFKNKEGKKVKLETIFQVLRQKGTTKIEKEIVQDILATEMFTDPKEQQKVQALIGNSKALAKKEEILDVMVDYDSFRASVEGALMPVQPIQTARWADYGADHVHFEYDHAESVVYNTPIEHGVGDHFRSLFEETRGVKVEYEIVPVPQKENVYVAMDKNRPQTNDPEELEQYVGSAGSLTQVTKWVEEYNSRDFDNVKAGVFGHVRRWDVGEDRYIAEMQSDFYQKNDAETEVTKLVLENPVGRAQKKIAKKMKKVVKVLADTPSSVAVAYEQAGRLMAKVRMYEADIKDLKALIKDKQDKLAETLEVNPESQYDPGPVIEDRQKLIKATEKRIKALKMEVAWLSDPAKFNFEDFMKREEFIDDYIHRVEAAGGVIEEDTAAKRYKRLFAQYRLKYFGEKIKYAVDHVQIEGNETISTFSGLREASDMIKKLIKTNPDKFYEVTKVNTPADPAIYKEQYEKYFYAQRDAGKLRREVPKTYTSIQKQFVAHRKNYQERMLREEIRAAAKDGMERLMIPTPRTIAVIEGYISGGDAGVHGMYEVTWFEDTNQRLYPGDEIDYGGEEMTVVFADEASITVAPTSRVNSWSVDDFISEEAQNAWENTSYELPDEWEITIFKPADENQALLPGFEEREQPDGEVAYEDADGTMFIVTDGLDDNYYGDLSDVDIQDAIEKAIDDNMDVYKEEAEDGTFIITKDEIINELSEMVTKNVEDRYSDSEDINQWLYDVGYMGSVNRRGTHIYSTMDDVTTEEFPQPSEMTQDDYADYSENEEDFDISVLNESHQGIVKKYEVLGETMKKFLPEDAVEMEQDDRGYWWYAGTIPEEEADKPVQLFQIKRGALTITDEKYLVSLFDEANLSTLIHETGHIFLNEMEQIIESGQQSKAFQQDYQSVLKWLGSKNGDITTEQHEKFARGFEAYLREGKAPSLEMEGAFARFRRWLMEVYKSAKDLNVTLNNQVRGVFDRLLTTSIDVEQSAQTFGMTPKTQEELDALGIIPEDQEYMKRLVEEAKTKAEAAMNKDKDRGLRKQMKLWRKQAKAQVDNDPGQKVADLLSKWDGVDRQELIDLYGSVVLDKLPKRVPPVFRKGGMPLEEAAFFGEFESVDDMVIALQRTLPKPEAIQAILDQKIAEHDSQYRAEDYLLNIKEYGDYLTILSRYYEGPVAEQEIDPLTKGDKKKGVAPKPKTAKVISRQAFTQFVKKALNTKSTRDAIRHDRYLAAMKKAQAAERKALLAGDMAAAQKANEQVRLNFTMAGQAIKNRKMVEKLIKRAKTVAKSKTVKLENRENIRHLIERFKLADNIFPQKPDALKPLSDLIDGGDFRDSFPASDFILNGTVKDYRDLAFSELQEVSDLISYLTVRNDKDVRLKNGEKVEDAARFSAEESYGMKTKKVREKFSILRKLTDGTRSFFSMLDSLNFIMIAKGAYKNVGKKGERSATEIYTLDPLIEAKDNEDIKNGEIFDKIEPFLTRLHKTIHGWNKKYGRKMVIEGAPTPIIFAEDGQTGWWTGEQIFSIALNVGNVSNFERLTKGYPDLNTNTINRLLALLEKEDWDAVQGIWDTINSLYPETDATHVRLNNFHMSKIEARPFKTKYGQYAGGYYPAVFNPTLSRKVAAFTEADDMMSRSEAIRQVPASKTGMTKERKSGVSLPLKLSLSVATSHIRDTIHYITHAEAVRDVDRITRTDVFAEEATRVLGKQVYNMIRPALKYVARPTRESVDPQFLDRSVNWMKDRSTAFILAWNASVAAKQMFSSPAAAFDMGMEHYIKGFAAVMKNPVANYEMMKELSPYMKQRSKSMDRELADVFNKMSADQKAIWFGDKAVTWSDARNFGFWPIRMMDMATVIPIWNGAYNKALAGKQDGIEAGDLAAAVKYADDIVRRTQPSAQPLDLTQFQRLSGLWRGISSFSTFTVGKYGQRQRLHYRAMRSGALSKADYAWHFFLEAVLPGIGMNMLFAVLWGEDLEDEETYHKVLVEAAKYITLTGLPVVNQFFSKYGGPLDSPMSAGLDHMKRALKDGGAYLENMEEKELKKVLWDVAHVISFVKGVPASKVVEKAYKGADQDEENIPGVKYLIPAPKK